MPGIGLILFLAVLQGATELFPISSLGHAVVIPPLFHLGWRQNDPALVPVLVVLHLGTAAALFWLYRREWIAIVAGLVRSAFRGSIESDKERLGMLLVVGTLPAVVVGFFLEKPLKSLFGAPAVAAAFLLVNGFVLLGAEWLRRRDERASGSQTTASSMGEVLPVAAGGLSGDAVALSHRAGDPQYKDAEKLSFKAALLIGVMQTAALLPGISRSGATMAGGLLFGLRHQEAARFSFLLATPVIFAAGVLEVPQLSAWPGTAWEAVAGGALAGLVAYLSARFLLRYLRVGRLDPFGYYCIALGAAALVALHP